MFLLRLPSSPLRRIIPTSGCVALLLASLGGLPRARAAPPTEGSFSPAEIEFFERAIRPLLARRCHKCHGPEKQQASLRLDSRSSVLKGGDTGPAIVPGKPAASLLIDAINYGQVVQMPPNSRLPREEVALLTEWVQRGATWPAEEESSATAAPAAEFDLAARRADHWAWQPTTDPPLPTVNRADWPLDPLDFFVLARLEDAGLEPVEEATRQIWLRRVSFALIGLPPSPQAIEVFLTDTDENAYEKVVTELLDSLHFGERWARYWMDLARYGESYGHEFDYAIPHPHQYRDYLIRALNADVPYDQFTREHIAGDLLPQPRLHPKLGFNESIIGTAFWWLGEAVHAPTDVRGDEAVRIDNQIDAFSKTFLGLTIACARCHDHKFDAISTKDYYALAGFLQSSHRQLAMLDPHGAHSAAAHEMHDMIVQGSQAIHRLIDAAEQSPADQWRRYLLATSELVDDESTADELQRVAQEHGVDKDQLGRWVRALGSADLNDIDHPLAAWKRAREAVRSSASSAEAHQRVRRQLAEADDKWSQYEAESVLLTDFASEGFSGWRATGQAFGDHAVRPGTWDVASTLTPIDKVADQGLDARLRPAHVADSGWLQPRLQGALRSPTFTLNHNAIHYRLRGRGTQVRLIIDGHFMIEFHSLLFGDVKFGVKSPDRFTWRVQAGDLYRFQGHRAHIELLDSGDGFLAVDQIRFSNRREAPPAQPSDLALSALKNAEGESLEQLARAYGDAASNALARWQKDEASQDQQRLVSWALEYGLVNSSSADGERVVHQLQLIRAQIDKLAGSLPKPQYTLALTDGAAENERVHVRGNHRNLGEVVARRLPEALGGAAPTASEQGSGRLLLAERVASTENPLTARVIVNRVWHHLLGRGVVASVDNFGVLGTRPTHPQLLDHLATRFVREEWSLKKLIRDIVLSSTYRMSSTPDPAAQEQDPANNLLHAARVRRLEGEAIRDALLSVSGRLDATMFGPSIPVHLTENMQGRGRPKSGPLDGNGRRSIYLATRRNFLSPMMLAFDTPIPFTTVGRRHTSNVPAQALMLMNDRFVVDQAKRLAERLLTAEADPRDRVRRLYLLAYARPATENETRSCLGFVASQAAAYGVSDEARPNDQRAWADLCHVGFNRKEFILIY